VSASVHVGDVVLATVRAVDRDAGENGTVRFSVTRCTVTTHDNTTTSLDVTSLNTSLIRLTVFN